MLVGPNLFHIQHVRHTMHFIAVALFIALLWAVGPVLQKYAMDRGVHQYAVLVLGSVAYFVCMIPFACYHWHDVSAGLRALDTHSATAIVLASVLAAFLANLLFLAVLKGHDTSVVTALTYSSPLFTCIIAWVFLRESMTVMRLAGIAAIVVGMVMLR